MFKRVLVAASIGILAGAGTATSAAADPKAEVVPLTCEGQTVEVAVNGNGAFTPGHLTVGTAVYVVQSIEATFTFTPPEGPAETEHFASSKNNVHGDLLTCTFDFSETTPEGTFHAVGTVVVFVTPAR